MPGFEEFEEDPIAEESSWSVVQLALAAACFLPMVAFVKLPLDFFFGSGWAIICYAAFLIFFATPTIYLQFKFGARYKRGLLCVLEKYSPWTLCFTIASMILNLVIILVNSVWIGYGLSYLFFTFFPCDGKYCTGASFIWGSCSDRWSEGDCKEGYQLIYNGPTAEEKFFFNFVLMRENNMARFSGFANWFDLTGLAAFPYLIGWLVVFLLCVGAQRIFGLLLYILSPCTLGLLLMSVLLVVIKYSQAESLLDVYLERFFQRFPSHVPQQVNLQTMTYDSFEYQPLVWGFLSTFVHLSQSLRLWNGVYPVLGRWAGGDNQYSKRNSLAWMPFMLIFVLVGQLPTLLMVFLLSSSFAHQWVRCYVGLDWISPFVVLPHVLSNFSVHPALAGCMVVAFLLCLILSQVLLLLTTVENIVDHLCKWHESIESKKKRMFRVVLSLLSLLLLAPLGLVLLTRTGFYWIRLVDWYQERLQGVLVLAQMCGFIQLIRMSPRGTASLGNMHGNNAAKIGAGFLLEIGSIIYYIVMTLLNLAVYAWYVVAGSSQQPADSRCLTFSRAPQSENDPILNEYRWLGWLIALMPLVLGLLIGLAVNLGNSRRGASQGVACCAYLWGGDRAVARSAKRKRAMSQDPLYVLPPGTGDYTHERKSLLFHSPQSTTDIMTGAGVSTMVWKPMPSVLPPPANMYETSCMTLQRMQRESQGIFGYDPREPSRISRPCSQGNLYMGTLEHPAQQYQRRFSQHSMYAPSVEAAGSQEDLLVAYQESMHGNQTINNQNGRSGTVSSAHRRLHQQGKSQQQASLLRKI